MEDQMTHAEAICALAELAEENEFLRVESAKNELMARRYRDDSMAVRDSLNKLAQYFTSGNSVPVERATILAKDFWRITGMPPNVS